MKTDELFLLDTNILVYAADTKSPFHHQAVAVRDKGFRGEISCCVSIQVLSEFFAVVTNPKRVYQTINQSDAIQEMEKYRSSQNILKIFPNPKTLEIMMDLLRKHQISMQKIHDLHLVATMVANNVNRIYTYNQMDFKKFNEIEALTP